MKNFSKHLLVLVFVVALASTANVSYAKGKKKGRPAPPPTPEETFKQLDTNGDDTLSLDEFKGSKTGDEAAKAEKQFKAWDTNNDGKLTLDEYKDGVASLPAPAKKAGAAKGMKLAAKGGNPTPDEVFKYLDKDGDGTLTLEEFKGTKVDKEAADAEKQFKEWDKDNDGKLTLDEYKAGVAATPPPDDQPVAAKKKKKKKGG